MTESSNILKYDKDNLNNLQKDLYYQQDYEEIPIESRFSAIHDKISWSATEKVEMIRTGGKQGQYIYNVNKKYDYLIRTYLRTILPEVSVKKEFKDKVNICWPSNIFHNIVKNAKLTIDEELVNEFDNIWLDIISQFYEKPGQGKRLNFDKLSGNIKILTEWNTKLPNYKINLPQPWFYSKHITKALPILKSTMNDIRHIYTFDLDIKNLLRMRIKKEDDEWKDIRFNDKYVNISNYNIPIPELWGRYALITDEERLWLKSKTQKIYIDDVVSCNSENKITLGQNTDVKLNPSAPCKCLFWVAQSDLSKNINNLSNYTTNWLDKDKGWNPCYSSSIKYRGNLERVKKIDHDHYDLIEGYYVFPSSPIDRGYNAYSFSYKGDSMVSDSTMDLTLVEGSLVVNINNTNPIKIEKETDEDGNIYPLTELVNESNQIKEKYQIHARLLVVRELTLTWKGGSKGFQYNLRNN